MGGGRSRTRSNLEETADQDMLSKIEGCLSEQELKEARLGGCEIRNDGYLKKRRHGDIFLLNSGPSGPVSQWALELPDDEITHDQDEIMDEIQQFYQVLFKAEENSREKDEAREKLVSVIPRQLTANISSTMLLVPGKSKIEKSALFIKLEFVKAYNGVDHRFQWKS
ncbi:hypothetical protein R1sor_027525 [Riccia sorocarpa]|uniref:Uncharacterized protein n=1 Tax=Riccia sorocarpa TaxID=122646 RepID=A0ABD3GG76_9MARC